MLTYHGFRTHFAAIAPSLPQLMVEVAVANMLTNNRLCVLSVGTIHNIKYFLSIYTL